MILARVDSILTQTGVDIPVDTAAAISFDPPNPPDFIGTTTITVTVDTTYADASIFGGFLPDSMVIHTYCTMVK